MSYLLQADDNFNYMDQSRRIKIAEFATYEEALNAAQEILDENLRRLCEPNDTAASLYGKYVSFGIDPFIVPSPDDQSFSAWDYAKERAGDICQETIAPDPDGNAQTSPEFEEARKNFVEIAKDLANDLGATVLIEPPPRRGKPST